ncbi:uncharacterized protein LOC127716662 [Mytilus californianus]|uniref:uncharacterized protein LOC127716662 n=1 Tax=Mytilus californianus TaxID=6549 RepID=UPI0022484803|nr:uncharacterized protein LOC127716662 [Mytilus californianus]
MLCCAENYKLVKLKNVCVGVLNTYINIQGIAFAFPVSVQFSLLNTQISCLKFISDNTEECLQMPGFISLPENCIELILSYKGLSCKEEVLFEYVMKCAVSLCQQTNLEINIKNKRVVLQTLIKYIRFPLMDVTYFTDVSRIGILTQKEVISVFQTIHGNFNGCFSAVKRNSQIKRMVRNVNDAQIIHLTSTQKPPFAMCIDVSCSVTTILHGISLGCMYNGGKFQCIITHLKVKSFPERKLPMVCPNNQPTVVDILSKLDNLKLGINDNVQLRDILLKEPVILSKDNWYVIEILVNNISGSVKSSNCWDSVIDGNIQVMFRKHSEKTENVHPELICGVLVSEK